MTRPPKRARGPLYKQLRWFINLRWLAASAVVVGAAVERQAEWFGGMERRFVLLGGVVLVYNAALSQALPRVRGRRVLLGLALGQLLLDMVALAALIAWTGGLGSPVVAFFVLHMVFASLLLPRPAAYAGAAAACVLVAAAVAVSGHVPQNRADYFALAGLLVTLVLTVTLTNHITHDLRTHHRRLVRQNRRIKGMARELRTQQQALVQHEKMVAMGQMAAGVTHEITNPLASIDSVLQLAQRRPERMTPETVQTLRDQVQRMNQIIQQMKTFAHPTEMASQTMPLNDVVEQAIGMVRFDRRMKNVQVLREFDDRAGSVVMLPQALQQVLVNLIINALDAMAEGEAPVLSVRTHRREGWGVVEVSDNGHGIDPRHMPRLFEPFFTTKPLGRGTGLGLSISYSLMQKQGGSISVRSQLGAGTTFVLRLPATSPSGHSHARESAPTPIATTENPAA